MDAKGLVLRAINLPLDNLEDFDGSVAVTADTYVKKQKKDSKFVTMLTQSNFLDALVRKEIVKQAKTIIRDEQYTPWKFAPEGQARRQDFSKDN
jgi:LPS sulfotransferase NodH